jgi:hypothetical protein
MEGLLGFKKKDLPVEYLLQLSPDPRQELIEEMKQEQQPGLLVESPVDKELELYREYVKPSEGKFKIDKNDPKDWQGGDIGVGKLIGTNRGVTPTALARHLNVDPRSITQEQIKQVDDQTAFAIFKEQYFPAARTVSDEVKPVAYTVSMLRPTALRYLEGIQDKKQAADIIIRQSFGVDMPQKGRQYMKNILGWVNRIRYAGGLPQFKNREQMFREYPVLDRIPKPKRKPPVPRRRM